MPRSEMTREELVALFASKATAPPPEANKLLVRHLQCKESIRLAGAVRQAMDRFAGSRQRAARRSIGTSSAPRITTLAPAFGQALPTLATVPTEYNHEVNAELLYDLCAALVKAGLGSPETWQQCGENAVVFAQRSIMSAIGAERGELLQRNVEYPSPGERCP